MKHLHDGMHTIHARDIFENMYICKDEICKQGNKEKEKAQLS
jgi:hypothetical protein